MTTFRGQPSMATKSATCPLGREDTITLENVASSCPRTPRTRPNTPPPPEGQNTPNTIGGAHGLPGQPSTKYCDPYYSASADLAKVLHMISNPESVPPIRRPLPPSQQAAPGGSQVVNATPTPPTPSTS